ncbi:MFS transporter [Desulfosporosinus sp. PR]|uniref:MFS transporter n=1 Tax=Candidatus Desulfosporosinus nitrosoreducens TaxID=3401928 RepID=UPI0027E69A5E|nr:MFS transporter [Desulfosporosinus sp. PR]MDQ7094372.1 MFS transporter [Desulfosporosinus sp. PR]
MRNFHRTTLFCVVTSFYWFSLYTYVPILSPYAESMGASLKMVGLILGSYGLMQCLARIPIGFLSDKLKYRKPFVISGLILSLISSMGAWYIHSVSSLLFFRALAGLSASMWVIYTILFSSYFDSAEVTKAVGILNSFNNLGQMAAMILGGIVAQIFGANYSFLLSALGAVIGILLSLGVVEKKDESLMNQNGSSSKISIRLTHHLLLITFLGVLSQLISYATVLGFTPIAAKRLGASDFDLGILTAVATLPGIISSALSGTFFTKKFGEKNTIAFGFILGALSAATIPFIRNINVLYVSQFIGGFGRGLVFPLLMGLSVKNEDSKQRATIMGFFQAMYGVGMFVGPFLTGVLGDSMGLLWSYLVTAIVSVIGGVMAIGLIDDRPVTA